MAPYPKPNHHVFVFHGKRSIMQSDTSGPKASQPFEVQGGVLRIASQEVIRLVSQLAHIVGELPVAHPKSRVSLMLHRSVQRPDRKSSRASSANASRRPAATSSSIWRSQAAASNSANHALNASSSAGVSRRTASSISLRLLITFSLLYTGSRSQPAYLRCLFYGVNPIFETRRIDALCSDWRNNEQSGQNGKVESHTLEFKRQAVERMKTCQNIHALARELKIQRKLLYTWKYQFGRPEPRHANLGITAGGCR